MKTTGKHMAQPLGRHSGGKKEEDNGGELHQPQAAEQEWLPELTEAVPEEAVQEPVPAAPRERKRKVAEKGTGKNRNNRNNISNILIAVTVALAVFLGFGVVAARLFNDVFYESGAVQTGAEHALTVLGQTANGSDDTGDAAEGLLRQASVLEEDLKGALYCAKAQNTEEAVQLLERVDIELTEMQEVLSQPRWKAVALLPGAGTTVKSANTLLEVARTASEDILHPMLAQMQKAPLSEMKTEEGFNIAVLNDYLDMLEGMIPEMRELADKLQTVDLSLIDVDGELAAYSATLLNITEQFDNAEDYIGIIRALMGKGEDKLYVLAAQNSAEIRSGGGFPGAVGTVEIKDGVLTVSDFVSCYDAFPGHMSNGLFSLAPTTVEDQLYGERMWQSHDASFSPDFERVGEIWAKAYEVKNRTHVDGVVSMTPTIIQDLLAFMEPIKLSNKMELNGDNAARVLQYDIYRKYMYGDAFNNKSAKKTDKLFAEAAKLTMADFVESFSIDHLTDYLELVKKTAADRRLMLWLADTEEQAIVERLGWSGGLNKDPGAPAIGIYYALTDSSKLGWFLNMDYTLSDATVNEDGSRSYDLTVKLTSAVTQDDINHFAGYVIGHNQGNIKGNLYVFSPAGGKLSNESNDSGVPCNRQTYNGLEVVFLRDTMVKPDGVRTLSVRVTTAPGVEAVPAISMTPTLQQYREA